MEANNYISKLKANGTSKDCYDLASAYKEYKSVNENLPTKDRGQFSLNVLCILCRNLEKAPTWRDKIDCKYLLTLSIDCIRETRATARSERVKTLASIYYIHKHVVKQPTTIPPELVLKISYMAFENDSEHLFKEHDKTYWSILADRLTYFDKLKTKANLTKLITKLTEDLLKTIQIYDTVQFCSNVLSYLVKKLYFLYSDTDSKLLHKLYISIFEKLSSKDSDVFKKLPEKDIFDIYVKLNDCFYIVAENASKNNYKDSLDNFVRFIITIVGHDSSLFHVLQTFYLNSICCLLSYKKDEKYIERILEGVVKSFEATEKLGYGKAMFATYPFINQLLRLFVEKNENLNINIQENILKIILFLMEKLGETKQKLKCDNCKAVTGLHDALKLSFLTKDIICSSLKNDINTLLTTSYQIIRQQYKIYHNLKQLKCANHTKFFRKLQTDVHNLAIILNKESQTEPSVQLFKIYLTHEIQNYSDENDAKNISRALYNKSICELDAKLYSEALKDAYLSLVFNNDKQTDKYMNLVMDIKAKSLKNCEDDKLQLMNVLEACKMAMDSNDYGNIKRFFADVKFSEMLRHEFSMYAKLWPSMIPVAGVWRGLWDLTMGKHDWVHAESKNTYKWVLFDIILESTQCVRNLHCKYYQIIIDEILQNMKQNNTKETDEKLLYLTLLFLKAEINLCEASEKYGWKVNETNTDLDKIQYNRTIPQEHEAIRPALEAVTRWTELAERLDGATPERIQLSLQISCVFVQQLLHLYYLLQGLQLAYICCKVARNIEDRETFISNAGILLYYIEDGSIELNTILSVGSLWCQDIDTETTLIFLCDAAIHYTKRGEIGSAARLVRLAQSWVLSAQEKNTDINLDLGIGRLLEAQHLLCKGSGPSILTALNGIQRHYLSIPHIGSGWCSRKQHGLCVRRCGVAATVAATATPAARRTPVLALPATPAAILTATTTNTGNTADAQVKIDNRLKHILGLQPNNEILPQYTKNTSKTSSNTPQDLEMMLDCRTFSKTQSSPSSYTIPAFKMPEYFYHKNCNCFACTKPTTLILACKTASLEASMYFRANELEIAENYFKGATKMIGLAEEASFGSDFINKDVKKKFLGQLKLVQIELLIELCYFEMAKGRHCEADDHIVTIHEITQEFKCDEYVNNEIMNLITASATVKNVVRKTVIQDLEVDFEAMKLSPTKTKTPETKKIPDNTKNIVVKDEDVMKVRRVIKLDLDDVDDKISKPKTAFKVPARLTKPVLEDVTPKPRRKPKITIQQPTLTPKVTSKVDEFFTPSTPEQFFTPMTSVKTYSKKLSSAVVKNLEVEFLTPVGKESEKKGRHLRRAVSPGKLEKCDRPRRVRKPVFSDK